MMRAPGEHGYVLDGAGGHADGQRHLRHGHRHDAGMDRRHRGAGALVKTGQGTLVLGGDNQYGGGTTVNAGAVQVARDANLGSRLAMVALNGDAGGIGEFSSARGVTIGAGNGGDVGSQRREPGLAGPDRRHGRPWPRRGRARWCWVTTTSMRAARWSTPARCRLRAMRTWCRGRRGDASMAALAASAGFTSARGVTIGAGNGAMSVTSGASLTGRA